MYTSLTDLPNGTYKCITPVDEVIITVDNDDFYIDGELLSQEEVNGILQYEEEYPVHYETI